MSQYAITPYPAERSVRVQLKEGFDSDGWEELQEYYRARIKRGQIFWDLDLRFIGFINSQLLGLIVGMNTEIKQNSGQLRLIIKEGSHVDQLLTISKLIRIMTVMYA